MALDLSMFRQNPLRSVAEYEGDYQKLDAVRQTLAANALAMQEKQRAAAEATQIKNALAGLGPQSSVEQRVQVLRGFGTPGALKLANDEIAAADDSRKAAAAVGKDEQTTAVGKITQRVNGMKMLVSELSRAPDVQTAQAAIGQALQMGAIGSMQAASGMAQQVAQAWQSPQTRQAYLAEMAQSVISEEAKFTQAAQDKRNAATNARIASEGAADRALRERLAKQALDAKAAAGGSTGSGPAAKPEKDLTQDQGKATSWLDRMNQTESVIINAKPEDLTSVGSPSALAGATIGSIPVVGRSGAGAAVRNFVETPGRQAVRNAEEVWVQGLLRSDTGAAYKDMEKADIVRAFFPQPGEGEDLIAQKAVLREGVRRSMQVRAGPGPERMDRLPKGSAAPVAIRTDADYAALKPGTRFITPDGKTGTKR